jgi:hypothetical protein
VYRRLFDAFLASCDSKIESGAWRACRVFSIARLAPNALQARLGKQASGGRRDSCRRLLGHIADQSSVAPKPRERSYADWFNQIVFDARSELGVTPVLDSQTVWLNVPQATHEQILVVARRG